jgi:hypothetical protein
LSTIRCFRFLRKQPFFEKIDTRSYIIWCDCGTHFRSAEIINYFLVELPLNKCSVEVNYFGEKHGKSACDQHFSVLSKYLEYASFNSRLTSSKDIVNAINSHQDSANTNRINMGLEPISVYTMLFELKIPEDVWVRKFTKINDLTCYHNFHVSSENMVIMSRVLTDCVESKKVKLNTTKVNDANVDYTLPFKTENTFKGHSFDLKRFYEKIQNTKYLLKKNPILNGNF